MSDKIEANRGAQRAAYGEPLSEIFDRIRGAFGLNQAGLAGVLGLSAPMLSQLNSAHRVKIGNPAVLSRVHQLNQLADQLAAGHISADQVPERLDQIKNLQGSLGPTTQMMAEPASDEAVVAGMRSLLRAVASGAELRSAAEQLAETHPQLAEVLRLYGTGPAQPALVHYTERKELF